MMITRRLVKIKDKEYVDKLSAACDTDLVTNNPDTYDTKLKKIEDILSDMDFDSDDINEYMYNIF